MASGGLEVISIAGEIVGGDATKFKRLAAATAGKVVVTLDSYGGKVLDGLMIGEAIRSAGFATAVTSGSTCASVCGLIWLAGEPRYVGQSGRIGFHAAYTQSDDDDEARETGAGNALVGAYLTNLGMPYKVVVFATSAPPAEMSWLHREDAQKLGIRVETLDDPKPARTPSAEPPRTAVSAAEQQVIRIVTSYYELWSRPAMDYQRLQDYYSDPVSFFGTSRLRSDVLVEKRAFAERWPIRRFTIDAGKLFVQCSDVCVATGVVEWETRSLERGAHSTGAANFVFKIVLSDSGPGGTIYSEDGSVLFRRLDPPSTASAAATPPASPSPPGHQVASAPQAYVDGRQARVEYERWVAGLPEGPFKNGVMFWAANRGNKPAPSCAPVGSPFEWQAGCTTARSRLFPSDLRRKSERDYWQGWNSL